MITEFKKLVNNIINPFPYRMYTRKHQCIFIHVPKAAGTSILHALSGKRIDRDHASYSDYSKASPEKFKKYFKFAFVRNPWDRVVSAYFYLLSGGNKSPTDLKRAELLRNEYGTFDKFIMNYLNDENTKVIATLRTQSSFLCNVNNEVMVDFIGKFENIDNDFKYVLKKLGIEKNNKLDKVNVNKRDKKSYHRYFLDEKVKKKVEEVYALDIKLFKYQFDD